MNNNIEQPLKTTIFNLVRLKPQAYIHEQHQLKSTINNIDYNQTRILIQTTFINLTNTHQKQKTKTKHLTKTNSQTSHINLISKSQIHHDSLTGK